MDKQVPRLTWVILIALSALTAAALTSALAMAQGEAPPGEQPAATPAAPEPGTSPAEQPAAGDVDAALAMGQELFGAQCARCHGEDGQASTPDGQALSLSPLRTDLDEAAVRQVVLGGCGAMVGYTDLSEEQLSALARYTVSLAR